MIIIAVDIEDFSLLILCIMVWAADPATLPLHGFLLRALRAGVLLLLVTLEGVLSQLTLESALIIRFKSEISHCFVFEKRGF